MPTPKIQIYNALKAYGKQISLARILQRKEVVISPASADDEDSSRDVKQQETEQPSK